MGRKLRELTIKDDFSVGVQGEIRLKPRNFGDFQRYPQSAYVQYASIVCLLVHRRYQKHTAKYFFTQYFW